jgi:hypothetical protein
MYRKILVAGLATFATSVALAAPALATVPSDETYVGNTVNQLRTHSFTSSNTKSSCSYIKAVNERKSGGSDSPKDTNWNDFQAHICTGDYIEIYTQASLNLDTPLADVKNVGFDYVNADIQGAGQVYIALEMNNGDTLFLDPTYCSTAIGTSGWSIADFSSPGVGCTIYVNGTVPVSSTAGESALQVYADQNPGVVVNSSYMIVSAAPAEHTIHLDRIMLGTGWSYDYSKLYAHQLAA